MLALMFFALLTISALAIDFSRLWSFKNELQTSADAAALAGAIELGPGPTHDPSLARSYVDRYASRNKVMMGSVTVDSFSRGTWDPTTATYTPNLGQNALRIVLSHQVTGLVMAGFGVSVGRMQARALAWAEGPVVTSTCFKPWALPYRRLMRVIPGPGGDTRPFTQRELSAFQQLDSTARTVMLRIASDTMPYDPLNDFIPIALPKYQAAGASGPYSPPPDGFDMAAYHSNIAGTNPNGCYGLSVSDLVKPMMLQDDIASYVRSGVCVGGIAVNGDCYNSFGQVGATIPVIFYLCGAICDKDSHPAVQLLGAFQLKKFHGLRGDSIVGTLTSMQALGPVGGGGSLLLRAILVN